MQIFIRQLLSDQRDLDLHNSHNSHPCSDLNQNHIGKSPGFNPLHQETHCSFASNIFMRKSRLYSGALLCGATHYHHMHCTCWASSLLMVHMLTLCTSSNGHEEVRSHVVVVSGWLKSAVCISWMFHQIFSTYIVGINEKTFGGSEVPWSRHLYCGGLTWRRLGVSTCRISSFGISQCSAFP